MLRYLHAHDLAKYPRLRDSMHRDRAEQFKRRLGWDVEVDANGLERDQYDDLDPIYVIWETPDGRHGGSARFLPTTGRTMVNEHFLHLTDGVAFRSPFIWECTRFCLAPDAAPRAASAVMLGGGEMMRAFGIDHYVGVFDAHMTRVYRLMGVGPEVLGTSGSGKQAISVGLWHYDALLRDHLLAKAGLSSDLSEHWFNRAFGRPIDLAMTA
jgi:N-acyl-L-homoserine lactone synthetase